MTNSERQANHRNRLVEDAKTYRDLRNRAGEMGYATVGEALDMVAPR